MALHQKILLADQLADSLELAIAAEFDILFGSSGALLYPWENLLFHKLLKNGNLLGFICYSYNFKSILFTSTMEAD